MLLAAGAWWVLRQPFFPIARHQGRRRGDAQQRRHPARQRGAAAHGNFFTVDLARARTAFESVPWVRSAVVRREFPNKLRVHADRAGAGGQLGATKPSSKLINGFGDVFEANVAEVDDKLPRLDGLIEQAGQVLGMYRVLQPMFAALRLRASTTLTLSSRGSWKVVLDSGAADRTGPRARAKKWRPGCKALPEDRDPGRGPVPPDGGGRRRRRSAPQRRLCVAVARRHHRGLARGPKKNQVDEYRGHIQCPKNTKTLVCGPRHRHRQGDGGRGRGTARRRAQARGARHRAEQWPRSAAWW